MGAASLTRKEDKMQDREKLIERIKKLLAVTEQRGATEQEAIQAALMAQKLMAEYDVNDFELGGDSEPIEESMTKRGRAWKAILAQVVAENFRCKFFTRMNYTSITALKRTAHCVFYGYKHDAEAARIVYERLASVGHKQALKHAKKREEELMRQGNWGVQRKWLYDDFVTAYIEGVESVLEKQSQALMIVCPPKVNDAYTELSKNFTKGRPVKFTRYGDSASREAGRQAGRDAVMAGRVAAGNSAFMLA